MAGALVSAFGKITWNRYVALRNKNKLLCCINKTNFTQERNIRNIFAQFNIIMKERRKLAGPDRLRRRSEWQEWNYKSELFAFPKRLQENISEETLRSAFTHKSYLDAEEKKRLEMGVPLHDVPLNLIPNSELITTGENIIFPFIKSYLRHCYPYLPEEGIIAIHDYLVSDDVLSHVSANIGTKDLILSEDFPVTLPTLALTLKAIIGAIAVDNNERKAQLFILDFICPQLIAKDILEIWNIPNVLFVVDTLLKQHGRLPSESRLMFKSGRNTSESIYQVGLFSDKVFLGQGTGETLTAAEEMAAYDVLRKLFHLTENEKPLPFGKEAQELLFNAETENMKLSKWFCKDFEDNARALM